MVHKNELIDEIIGLIEYAIKEQNIEQKEICIAAPQWYPLASLTRELMVKLPDYSFNGPGMAPFARDIDNFWFKLSRIVLTEPSPTIYIRRLRWSKEVLQELNDMGADVSAYSNKALLRFTNSITIEEKNGLDYLQQCFEKICTYLKVNIQAFKLLNEHYVSFFESSRKRINRLKKEGNAAVEGIDNFKKVFKQKEGITISSIHGTKGEEYDTVIAFGLLDSWVPHFSDTNGVINSKKMLYVISSRAKKNLHLISETGRNVHEYYRPHGLSPTSHLLDYKYDYCEIE
jgi:superfamily I DNA/RNA helicase